MDIHLLNSDFKVTALLESYDSLIWTERYHEAGDFELVFPNIPTELSKFRTVKYLRIPDSDRLMVVESRQEQEQVTVKGRSLESILDRRVIESSGARSINDIPALINQLVRYNIGPNAEPVERQIPSFFMRGASLTEYKDPTAGYDPITYGDNLYDAVVALCKAADVGIRITNPMDAQYIEFQVYNGKNRTLSSNTILFSEALENIEDVSRFSTLSTLKNVAVVNLPPWDDTPGIGEIWRVSNGATPSGYDRREVWTEASELRQDESFNATNKPTRAKAWGKIELTGHKATNDFDFQISSTNPYRYRVDYNLGDLVVVVDPSGENVTHRVTEYIHSFGVEGEAEYPTLSVVV